ncbi:hypothetical protein [Diaphorobacter nitroreducens]|uniref:hypothetical protein n=1 Tax=Diaphorobacter nitroreducens TaxID=164759 RepID=UPI0035B1571E
MIRLTELEERLAAADGDVLRNELAARLQQTALQFKTRLARPLPRDEFVATNACLQAALAAQAVLDTWTTGTGSRFPTTSGAVAHR